MKVRGLLIVVDTGDDPGFISDCEIEEKEPDEFYLKGLYEALNCSTIDIVTRKIGGQTFDIVCDDEALLKDGARASAFDSTEQPLLFGNLFVCKNDGPNLASLTDSDMAHLLNNIGVAVKVELGEGGQEPCAYPALINVGYVG